VKKKDIRDIIKKRGYSVGSWISTDSTDIAEILSNCGFDWMVVDLEHSSTSINKAIEMVRVIDLSGINPLVRLTSNDANLIKRVMDGGSSGIVVPNVKNEQEAQYAVNATRYGPFGNRGVGLARAQGYGNKFKEYLEWQKKYPIVIVQIEDIEAIDNLEKIFDIPEVDGFIIGPYDLSCSMGIPGEFENKDFIKTIKYILNKGKNKNCYPGIHIVEPDEKLLSKSIKDGYQLIAYSVDIRMIDFVARKALKNIQK